MNNYIKQYPIYHINKYIKMFQSILNDNDRKEAYCNFSSICSPDCPIFPKCYGKGDVSYIASDKERYTLIYNYMLNTKLKKIKEILC